MLIRIKDPANIPGFLAGVKAKKEKLFGFGHRVYKNFDPRAKLIQALSDDVRPVFLASTHVMICVCKHDASG
jgi:citrate synthase